MSVTGEPGGPPVKVGVPITDLGAGLFALVGDSRGAALSRAHRPRAVHRHVARRCRRRAVGVGGDRVLLRRGRARADRIGASDERAVPGDPLRRRLHHARRRERSAVRASVRRCSGIPSGAATPDYVDDTSRVKHRDELAREIETVTMARPRAHWLTLFEANGLPCGPINNYAEVFADPQVQARGLVVETEHPRLGRIRDARRTGEDVGDAADIRPARAAPGRAHAGGPS